MLATDRFMRTMTTPGVTFRMLSAVSGITLIIAGLTILLFPQILIAMIAAVFIAAGILTLAGAFRRSRRSTVRYTYWNE